MTTTLPLDWADLQLLALLAEEGTLAAAARRLHVDQTTASRRLARLEETLGTALFDRIDRRLVPRPALAARLADLEAVAGIAERVVAALRDERLRLTGRVLISAVDLLATDLLAPAIGRFRAGHPGVRLEIDTEERNVSLGAREADIALRLARASDDTALTRRLALLDFAFYGPAGDDGRTRLPIAAYGDRLAHLPERRWLAEHHGGEEIAFHANRAGALIEAVAAGHRAVLPMVVADADPRLVRLGGAEPVVTREVWLLVHPERRHDAAVIAALDWIETTLRQRLRR